MALVYHWLKTVALDSDVPKGEALWYGSPILSSETLKRLKIYIKNTIGRARLNRLDLINIHRNV